MHRSRTVSATARSKTTPQYLHTLPLADQEALKAFERVAITITRTVALSSGTPYGVRQDAFAFATSVSVLGTSKQPSRESALTIAA
jgi:hypothetical protein